MLVDFSDCYVVSQIGSVLTVTCSACHISSYHALQAIFACCSVPVCHILRSQSVDVTIARILLGTRVVMVRGLSVLTRHGSGVNVRYVVHRRVSDEPGCSGVTETTRMLGRIKFLIERFWAS